MNCVATVVGRLTGVYGYQLSMVMIELGLWATSLGESGKVFYGYDVAQLFGFRGKKIINGKTIR